METSGDASMTTKASPISPKEDDTIMMTDIHPELGRKIRVGSLEAAENYVREEWPKSRSEGSTGSQRSFWIGAAGQDAILVAHCWKVQGRTEDHWVRRSQNPANQVG